MKFMLFITFVMALAKGGIWIALGVILRNHFETAVSLLFRKPKPDGLVDDRRQVEFMGVVRLLGLALIILGVLVAFLGLLTWINGMRMPSHNFNFNFK